MVLIHDSVHFMGEDCLWDLGEDLGKQRGLFFFFVCHKLLMHPETLTLPRQGFLLLLSASWWLLK